MGFFSNLWSGIKNVASSVWGAVKKPITGVWNVARHAVGLIPGVGSMIKSGGDALLSGLSGDFKEAGKHLLRGAVGTLNPLGGVGGAVTGGIANKAIDSLKKGGAVQPHSFQR